MLIRIKPGGKYKYVEIVQSYRDPVTKPSVPLTEQRLGRLLTAKLKKIRRILEKKGIPENFQDSIDILFMFQ